MIFYERKENDWRLVSILVDLFQSNIHSSFSMIFWLGIDLLTHSTITYLTVGFLSSANLRILTLLLISKIVESFIKLRVVSTQKTFVLLCIRQLYTLVYKRLFGTDWHRLKLVDHEEMRRKISEACTSIQSSIESIIENCNIVYGLVTSIITISLLCPWKATIGLIFAYLTFFLIYVRQRSQELSALRAKNYTLYDELHEKSNRVMGRSLDYILHRERNELISKNSSLQVAIESLYYTSEYVANRLLFSEELLGKACTFIIISILLSNTTNPFVVIPIYHYLSSLVVKIDAIINISTQFIRRIKDYDLLQPLLEEYKPRFEASQFIMEQYLTIHNLHFTYEEVKARRKRFTLELSEPITFQMGETILVTGNSGAGKSTFYDIISGCISKERYTTKLTIDNNIELKDAFHNLESLRTLVLQDTQMDFKSSIFTMITDIEDDDQTIILKQKQEEEERVWRFLRLVEIDNFVEESLQGQLHVPVENRLSGGQKTRLMLARALSRAEQRQSQILILDEPDRGLPSEITFRIMLNIVRWFRTKGILLLTLHNDRVRERLPLDHILHIEHGRIKSISTNNNRNETVA